MIAETVYPIVKSLPIEEQLKLFKLLEKDLQGIKKPRKRKQLISDEQARARLLKILLK